MTSQPVEVTIHTDGGSRGNPGPAAIGAEIMIRYPNTDTTQVKQISETIGIATNNQAEYKALVKALELVSGIIGDRQVCVNVYLDSLLVVSQVNGLYKIKDSNIREYYFRIQQLTANINGTCIFHHIHREENFKADLLVNQALDR